MLNIMRLWGFCLALVLLSLTGCQNAENQIVTSGEVCTEAVTIEQTEVSSESTENPTEFLAETEGIGETEGIEQPKKEVYGGELKEALWIGALENVVVEILPPLKDNAAVKYDQVVCMEWTYSHTESERSVTVLHYDDMRVLGPDRRLDGEYRGVEGKISRLKLELSEKKCSADEANKLINRSDYVIDTRNQISFIGNPLGTDENDDEDQCRAAAFLIEAALHCASEMYFLKASVEDEMKVSVYLIESNYDLNALEGKLLIQLGENDSAPQMIEVSYFDSCREAKAEYSIEINEKTEPFYAIESAICFSSTVTSKSLDWKLLTWEDYLAQSEKNDYGTFKYEVGDCDGDGMADTIFEDFNGEIVGEYYLFLSGGDIIHLEEKPIGDIVKDRNIISADFTGDGVDELFYTYTMAIFNFTEDGHDVWGMTEDGFSPLVIKENANGSKITNPMNVPVQIVITKVDDTHFIVTQPDSNLTMEFEVAENTYDNYIGEGMRTCVVRELQVIMDEQKGNYFSLTGGFNCGGYSFQVSWILRCVDGVWGIEEFTVVDKMIPPPPAAG